MVINAWIWQTLIFGGYGKTRLTERQPWAGIRYAVVGAVSGIVGSSSSSVFPASGGNPSVSPSSSHHRPLSRYIWRKDKQQMLIDIMNHGMDDALARMRIELPQMKSAEEGIGWIVQAQIAYYARHKSQTKASVHEMGTLGAKHTRAMDEKQESG
jgi:hypothetical protein